MNETEAIASNNRPRRPWNKGKLIGAKPPLRVSHVWSIRTKLQLEGRTRDLALFNLAIDSKLRGCDVVAAQFADLAPTAIRSIERRSARKRPVARSDSSSPNRRGKRLTSI
jgi:hypothetical protein